MKLYTPTVGHYHSGQKSMSQSQRLHDASPSYISHSANGLSHEPCRNKRQNTKVVFFVTMPTQLFCFQFWSLQTQQTPTQYTALETVYRILTLSRKRLNSVLPYDAGVVLHNSKDMFMCKIHISQGHGRIVVSLYIFTQLATEERSRAA